MDQPPHPEFRRLRIFAFDPSVDVGLDAIGVNQTVVQVPWEDLAKGPRGRYLEVMDIDPASGGAYAPVDLNHPHLLATDGLPPSTGNPQFHQQMVYAVAMTTITQFERALGRVSLWAEDYDETEEKYRAVEHLRIYPHALREPNAYYDPDKVALLFGYFSAKPVRRAAVLPGGMVFTCLSQDVIAHETTHALLDGLHPRFAEPTNADVLAFHEAFADVVALFQHFTFPEVLRHQIARTRGDLASENLLAQLAREFSQGSGHYGALRDALGENVDGTWRSTTPETVQYTALQEPHDRGAVLVGAVFDAFILMYKDRTADLLRIASAGTGVLDAGALHPDLVNRLASEAASISGHILQMCIRALDYCPPVDITFGEYLRALVTADHEVSRADERGYRAAFIEAFRRRGIYPPDVRSLSEDSLRWEAPPGPHQKALCRLLSDKGLISILEAVVEWDLRCDRIEAMTKAKTAAGELHRHLERAMGHDPVLQEALGLDLKLSDGTLEKFEVHAVRPARRISRDGQLQMDLVVEILQTRDETDEANAIHGRPADGQKFRFRGGCTLLIDLFALQRAARATPQASGCIVRYSIYKRMTSQRRRERQWAYVHGQLNADTRALYFGASSSTYVQAPFAMVHRHATGAEHEH